MVRYIDYVASVIVNAPAEPEGKKETDYLRPWFVAAVVEFNVVLLISGSTDRGVSSSSL